jgi:glutathione S-transferase
MTVTPVVLHKFLPAWGLPDLSPFCFKVETYLRLAQVPYTTLIGDSRKAPKQKLPMIDDGGRKIPDSSAIVAHLEATRGRPLDAELSAEQRALATAVRSMLEEHLYFLIVYERWQDDHNWQIYQPVFVELARHLGIPGLLRGFIADQVRKQMLTALRGQGAGRHRPEEIAAAAQAIVDSVDALCVGPYFFGERPRTLDATVYAFLDSILSAPFEGPVKTHLAGKPKLVAYCEGMRKQCFG